MSPPRVRPGWPAPGPCGRATRPARRSARTSAGLPVGVPAQGVEGCRHRLPHLELALIPFAARRRGRDDVEAVAEQAERLGVREDPAGRHAGLEVERDRLRGATRPLELVGEPRRHGLEVRRVQRLECSGEPTVLQPSLSRVDRRVRLGAQQVVGEVVAPVDLPEHVAAPQLVDSAYDGDLVLVARLDQQVEREVPTDGCREGGAALRLGAELGQPAPQHRPETRLVHRPRRRGLAAPKRTPCRLDDVQRVAARRCLQQRSGRRLDVSSEQPLRQLGGRGQGQRLQPVLRHRARRHELPRASPARPG